MAEKRKSSTSLAKMLPNSTKIDVSSDRSVIVAGDKKENDLLNKVHVGVLRHLIDEAITKWKDEGLTPTPKELAEITKAIADVVRLSGEVYREDTPAGSQRPMEKAAGLIDLDFNKEQSEDETTDTNPEQPTPGA